MGRSRYPSGRPVAGHFEVQADALSRPSTQRVQLSRDGRRVWGSSLMPMKLSLVRTSNPLRLRLERRCTAGWGARGCRFGDRWDEDESALQDASSVLDRNSGWCRGRSNSDVVGSNRHSQSGSAGRLAAILSPFRVGIRRSRRSNQPDRRRFDAASTQTAGIPGKNPGNRWGNWCSHGRRCPLDNGRPHPTLSALHLASGTGLGAWGDAVLSTVIGRRPNTTKELTS